MIAGVVFLAIGFVSFLFWNKLRLNERYFKGFHTTKGTLIAKSVEEKTKTSGGTGRTKRVAVNFTYNVNTTPYESHTFEASELMQMEKALTEKEATTLCEAIPQELTVYFDPESPDKAFIYRSSNLKGLFLGVSIALMAFGTVLILSSTLA